jgi:hypothetical protein
MPFYMDHPEHGAHICYTPEDVSVHEKSGWRLRAGETQKPATEPKKSSEIEKLRSDLNEMGVVYDNRWGVAKLREALNEALS